MSQDEKNELLESLTERLERNKGRPLPVFITLGEGSVRSYLESCDFGRKRMILRGRHRVRRGTQVELDIAFDSFEGEVALCGSGVIRSVTTGSGGSSLPRLEVELKRLTPRDDPKLNLLPKARPVRRQGTMGGSSIRWGYPLMAAFVAVLTVACLWLAWTDWGGDNDLIIAIEEADNYSKRGMALEMEAKAEKKTAAQAIRYRRAAEAYVRAIYAYRRVLVLAPKRAVTIDPRLRKLQASHYWCSLKGGSTTVSTAQVTPADGQSVTPSPGPAEEFPADEELEEDWEDSEL